MMKDKIRFVLFLTLGLLASWALFDIVHRVIMGGK